MTLGKLLNSPVPQFSYLLNIGIRTLSASLVVLRIKCINIWRILIRCLVYSKHQLCYFFLLWSTPLKMPVYSDFSLNTLMLLFFLFFSQAVFLSLFFKFIFMVESIKDVLFGPPPSPPLTPFSPHLPHPGLHHAQHH